jgi:hypothetical protein
MAFDADVHRNPGRALHGGSAGTGFLEYIDARNEPVGWKAAGFKPGAGWTRRGPKSHFLAGRSFSLGIPCLKSSGLQVK